MASDLDSLIDFYQWEIKRVKSQIDELLRLQFYKEVEFDYDALAKLQRELDVLLTLKDSKYANIKRLKENIEFYKTGIEEIGKHRGFKEIFKIRIREKESELEALLKAKNKPISFETQYVDDALYKLYSNEILAFNLYLNDNKQIYLSLNLVNTNEIRVAVYLENKDDYSWYKKYSLIKDLKFLDFEDGGMYLTRKIHNSNTLLEVKELISRIVIGLKNIGDFKNEIYLELINSK
ncbi:hypothetical protein [Maribacter spongiicola]|uniref:hypothetical protein n=1 Tax=Maribacter spongiicola TaxID=1206753 RepID=UPI003F9DBD36